MRLLSFCALLFVGTIVPVRAQELVHFPTLPASSVTLDGYLWQTPREGKHPAVVFLHGCGGILGQKSRKPLSRETAWAKALNDRGYSVLAVDSFTPRGYSNMCAPATFVQSVFDQRPADAYAALAYLQAQ